MTNQFKENVRLKLIVAAQSYFLLMNKNILLKSKQFANRKVYKLAFTKYNFLHLSGVLTNLDCGTFFEKCFNGTLECDDFTYDEFKNKNMVKSKIKHLIHIGSFFNSNVFVQEDFVKNTIVCEIGTSNGVCTLGFTGGKGKLFPKTLLDNNRLNNEKCIIQVVPIVKNIY
mgnify:CR=1 FL=1